MVISRILVFALVISVFVNASFSQVSSDEHHICDQDFARSLAAQLAADARAESDTHKKVKSLIRLGDFTWELDEARARDYLTEAYRASVENFKEKGFETRQLSDDPRSLFTQLPDLRFEVLRAIAKHDPAWARRLSEELMAEYERSAKNRRPIDEFREIHSLMSVAQDSVETNPELAIMLFRQVMAYPLDYHWYFGLNVVAGKNDAFAGSLYMELLQRYRNETPRRLLFLSAYPFAATRIMGADRMQYGSSLPDGMLPQPALQQRFIETFLTRSLFFVGNAEERMRPPDENRFAEAVYIVSALAEMEPIVVERFPHLLQRLGEAKARATSLISEDMNRRLGERERSNASVESGFDARLKELEEADEKGVLTDFMILGLVRASKTEEQFKTAESWLDKIKEDRVRTDLTNYFWFLRSELAIEEERFSDAERYAKKVPELEHRTILAFKQAEKQLQNINDRAFAYQTLNEIAKLARTSETSVTKAKVLLGLAFQYEKFDHGFALEELAEAVRVINRLKDPDLLSAAAYRQIIGKNFGFTASYGTPGYDLEKTFLEISRNDFELALSNARALDDRFLRTIAVLAVAKNCREKARKEATETPKN